jgi:hypothetical protein
LVMDLLRDYFKGDMPAPQLGQRTWQIASQHFTGSEEFYALVVSAFQGAVDAALAAHAHTKQSERKLLNAMASLKQEFGLTDRYWIEAWRSEGISRSATYRIRRRPWNGGDVYAGGRL